MTLRWRLTLILAATAVVAIGSASIAAYFLARGQLYGEVDRELTTRSLVAERAFDFLAPTSTPGLIPALPEGAVGVVRLDATFQVINSEGEIIFSLPDGQLPVTNADLVLASGGGEPVARSEEIDGVPYRVLTAAIPGGGAVILGRDVSEIDAALAGLGARLALATLSGAALAAGAGWLIARRTMRPIEAVAGAAEQVAATQQLTGAIPVGGPGEVVRLARSFNTMLTALDASRRQQRQLVVDAGHELRTPLTALRTNLEMLRRASELPPDDRRGIAETALAEAEELSLLADELVDLAADVERSDEPVTDIELRDLVEKVAARSRRRYGREVLVSGEGSVVRGRASQIERALGNLIDNADKWSPDGAAIEIELEGHRVEVRDQGPGIAAADLPHIFDRFYRAATARTMSGSGLGLAIVRHVVEGSGGRVFAANSPEGGAVVGFELL